MSMIQRLQQLSVKMFQQSLKTYKLKDVTIHKKAKPHSLIENMAFYPNTGAGFHVWRKDWPQGTKIRLTEGKMKSNRFGRLFGIKTVDSKEVDKIPTRLTHASQRGIWEYSVDEAPDYQLDNGMVYTKADFQAYKALRENRMNKKSEKQKSQQQK